jgi:hypothetical protein
MIVSIAGVVVFVVGAAVSVLCIWGMVVPEKLIRLVRRVLDRKSGIYVAVGSRLLLGGALILSAPASKFALIFNIIGLLALVGAIVVPLIGRARLATIIDWFARFPPGAIRAWLLFGLAFGGFLIYGILPRAT